MSPQGKAAADSWKRTLEGIPTVVGRLAYLSSLRNANTGIYEHFGMAQRIGPDDANAVIRNSHLEIFQEWLCFGLTLQKQELEDYFAELEGDKTGILSSWLALEPWTGWLPADSRDVERQLFETDLKLVVDLIRIDCGVASRDPDS